MEITLLSMMLSQSQVQQAASISVMKHALGNVEQQGEAVHNLLHSASIVPQQQVQKTIHPHLGHHFDIKV
ncbi:MAG: YjfB family protein [Bacillaceae bacterium]|nr:YjfB family protein [Bacillaceae bacterium]